MFSVLRLTKHQLNFSAVCGAALLIVGAAGTAQAQNAQDQQTDQRLKQNAIARARPSSALGQSNEKIASPPRITESYPLPSDAAREKSSRILQQTVVDLLSLFNQYKEAHWNLNGPLYLPLHEFYQNQADMYRKYADVFAERDLSLGYSIDGRYGTIAKTTNIPDLPAGYITDNESLKLLIDRVTIFQKEVYQDIRDTQDSDPPTSNKYQDLAYDVDHNLWQLRIHLKQPGSLGENLPWAGSQARDRAGNTGK